MVSLDKQEAPVPEAVSDAPPVAPFETWRIVVMLSLFVCMLLAFFIFPIAISSVISLVVAGLMRVLGNPKT